MFYSTRREVNMQIRKEGKFYNNISRRRDTLEIVYAEGH